MPLTTGTSSKSYVPRGRNFSLEIEPDVGLAGTGDCFVLAELGAGDGAVASAEGAEHGQVVTEETLGRMAVELGQEVDDCRVFTTEHVADYLAVSGTSFGRAQV